MGKSVSRVGGMLINAHVSLNSELGDDLVCSHCNLPIKQLFKKGQPYRDNRVDCEDKKIETYHLICYDLLLLGRVLPMTKRKVKKLREEFGES